jgi:hypothetical protein
MKLRRSENVCFHSLILIRKAGVDMKLHEIIETKIRARRGKTKGITIKLVSPSPKQYPIQSIEQYPPGKLAQVGKTWGT